MAAGRSLAELRSFKTDPYWKDCILFYEYFHGDNGAGIGASHQTGWTGTIAKGIQLFGYLTKADALEDWGKAVFSKKTAPVAKPVA